MNRESAILRLMHTPGIGVKRLSRLLQKLQFEQYPIEEFIAAPKNQLIEKYKLTEEMVNVIKSEMTEIEQLLEELWKHDIRLFSLDDSLYPAQLEEILTEDAPPVLFVKGNLDILTTDSVGFCGSRKATERGSLLVKNSAGEFAKKGINVISGYAHGIDLAAHIGAVENNGTTTFVLPLGILNFQLKSALSELISENNYLVISEFIPKLGWEVHNAMRRNSTICGLSKAIILVEPGLKGGTFEAGKAAIKYNRPLFVVEHAEQEGRQGNDYFLQRGAKPIKENADGSLELKLVTEAISSTVSQVKQQSLF